MCNARSNVENIMGFRPLSSKLWHSCVISCTTLLFFIVTLYWCIPQSRGMVSGMCPICGVWPFQSIGRNLSSSASCSHAFYETLLHCVAKGQGTHQRYLQFEAEEELNEDQVGNVLCDDNMDSVISEVWEGGDSAHVGGGTDAGSWNSEAIMAEDHDSISCQCITIWRAGSLAQVVPTSTHQAVLVRFLESPLLQLPMYVYVIGCQQPHSDAARG